MPWHVIIPGDPKGRTNPTALVIGGKARIISSRKTRRFEAIVADAVDAALEGVERLDVPLCLDILAVFPRPGRLDARHHPDGLIIHGSRPDRDNIEKAVQDGMVAVWKDDCLVAVGQTVKAYAERDGTPRTELWLDRFVTAYRFRGHTVSPEGVKPERATTKKPRAKSAPASTPTLDL